MSKTDPISDALTIARNAIKAKKKQARIPLSKLCHSLFEVIKNEGFIKKIKVDDSSGSIIVEFKYFSDGRSCITGLKRISKPGRRVYVGSDQIPKVLHGFGVSILSTSNGILANSECKKLGIGGEILCQVW